MRCAVVSSSELQRAVRHSENKFRKNFLDPRSTVHAGHGLCDGNAVFIDLLVLTSRSYIIPVSRLLGTKKRRRRTRDDERNIAIRKAQLHAIVDGERIRDGLGSCGKICASQLQVLSFSFSRLCCFFICRDRYFVDFQCAVL